MKYCVRCGNMLNTDAQFCGNCGLRQPYVPPELLENRTPTAACPPMPTVSTFTPISMPSQSPVTALVPVYYTPLPRHKKGLLPFLIWSLFLVPFFNIIGTPLAVIAAILCLSADADHDESSDRKLGRAAVLCVIATVIDIATLIFLFASSSVVINNIG